MRLPKAFRFDADAVRSRRDDDAVILEPIEVEDEWGWLGRLVGQVYEDVLAAMEEDVPQHERPELDDLSM